jgi:hypothetical protein
VPDWWPHQRLIVLADDAGHRALPVRLRRHPVKLWRVFSHPDDRDEDRWDDHAAGSASL